VEGDLSQLADETGVDKDHLIRLVEETGRLEKTIRKQLQAQIMQQVMTTVISASGATNQDFTLKDHDVQLLQSRLASVSPQHQPDVTNFRQLLQRQLQQNGSGEMTLPQVMKLLRNLVKDSANTK
jgi:FKBP-type peptidyl-prolyl cis-trans isomerase (trigger factor)